MHGSRKFPLEERGVNVNLISLNFTKKKGGGPDIPLNKSVRMQYIKIQNYNYDRLL